jgi:PAS domain S-box-containing protein
MALGPDSGARPHDRVPLAALLLAAVAFTCFVTAAFEAFGRQSSPGQASAETFPWATAIAVVAAASAIATWALLLRDAWREPRENTAAGAIREGEERFACLAAAAFEGIAITENGVFLDANEQLAQMLGTGVSDLIGQHAAEFVATEHRALVAAIQRSGSEQPYSHLARRRDGSVFPVEIRAKRILYKGRTARVTAVSDLTARMAAEQALADEKNTHEQIVDLAPMGILQTRPDGTLLAANRAFARILGYPTKAELIGVDVTRAIYYDPEDRDRILRQGSPPGCREAHVRFRKKDGSPVWVHLTGRAIWDPKGEVIRYDTFVRDISDDKRAQEERDLLHAEVERAVAEWQATFDRVESALLILDDHGVVIRVNQSAVSLLKEDHAAVVGRGIEELSFREPWMTAFDLVAGVLKTGAPASAQAKDEATGRTWLVVASAVTLGGAGESRIALSAQDITKIAALQESLRRSERMAAIGSLVAGVAHEVRNPLFGISANLDVFERELGERDDFTVYTKLMRSQVARLSRLMQELLDYGKPLVPALSPVRPGEVLGRAAKRCAALAWESGVTLLEHAEADLPSVEVDPVRMDQVLENLVANAIQHSPRGGTVELRATLLAPDGPIVFKVEDEGRGIATADMPRLFEPFFSRRVDGTGLGLSIVQQIVEAHGGSVEASNRAPCGAAFAVKLPLSFRAR